MYSSKNRIEIIESKVKLRFENEGSGHDWWHIHRVRNLALQLAENEVVDREVVELAALLHDIADHKLHGGDVEKGLELGENWLIESGCKADSVESIMEIVKNVSFKGANVKDAPMNLEGQIVQDADRLDALGAIGVARTFAYGGSKGHLLYHPEQQPEMHSDFEQYKNSKGHVINHFYEKLLLLKDRMNTQKAKEIAQERHDFMLLFLDKFYQEWNGKNLN